MLELWVDKYRPKSLKDYIWQDSKTRDMVERWVSQGATDNILLSGPPGVGKTSLAGVLIRELNVGPGDSLWMNASRENSIDDMRTKVQSFIETGGWGGMKYVVLDECDRISRAGQDSLKSSMEEFSHSVRWVLTTNSPHGVVDAVKDRCTKIDISKPNRDDYEAKMVSILVAEGVPLDDEEALSALDEIVKKNYPSLRGCIRDMQSSVHDGRLTMPSASVGAAFGQALSEALRLFRDRPNDAAIKTGRKLLSDSLKREDIDEAYSWLAAKSSEMFTTDEDLAIMTLAKYQFQHAHVADPEINLTACLLELSKLR